MAGKVKSRRGSLDSLPRHLRLYDQTDWAPEGVDPWDSLQAHYFGLLDYRTARADALGVSVATEAALPIEWARECECGLCERGMTA